MKPSKGSNAAVASSSKSKLATASTPVEKSVAKVKEEPREESKPQALKPKPSGKLDFSKATVRTKPEPSKAKEKESAKLAKEEDKPVKAVHESQSSSKGLLIKVEAEAENDSSAALAGMKFGPPRGKKKIAAPAEAKARTFPL